MQPFDLIVVGSGSAGKTVAETVVKAGKSVAIIDRQPLGGTCSQRGCDPKKVLVGAAELVARSAQLTGRGINQAATIDWPALMAFKRTFTDPVPENTAKKLADEGITTFGGTATFVAKDTLRVGNDALQAPHIVLAAGAKPRPLGIPGEAFLLDSTDFLALERLPAQLVLVGGGYIAFEFASIAARAGASVTILHRGKRPLEGFDADLVGLLVKAMEAMGVRVVLEATVEAIEGQPGHLSVQYQCRQKRQSVSGNIAVHAAGRVADVDELALETAGVTVGEKGIRVNEYGQSVSNPAVYACGDAADRGLPLTPVAGYEGRIVASNILKGNHQTFGHDPVPSAVFTVPPLASVGLTEEEAATQGLRVTRHYGDATGWYSARRINDPVAGFKTLVDEATGLVVGAHLLGSGSEETINLFALAMRHRIPAKALAEMLFTYPTHASDLTYMLTD